MQNTILIINGHLLYPFKARYVFFFFKYFFFQTLAYMLIWSSKVVTWVWFLAWAILLAKNNARSWKVAHFSQVELITCFHEFWNYAFSRNFICFVFLRGIWDLNGHNKCRYNCLFFIQNKTLCSHLKEIKENFVINGIPNPY